MLLLSILWCLPSSTKLNPKWMIPIPLSSRENQISLESIHCRSKQSRPVFMMLAKHNDLSWHFKCIVALPCHNRPTYSVQSEFQLYSTYSLWNHSLPCLFSDRFRLLSLRYLPFVCLPRSELHREQSLLSILPFSRYRQQFSSRWRCACYHHPQSPIPCWCLKLILDA